MFNNLLMRSPLRYSMMERRFLYKLSEAIKMRYERMNLNPNRSLEKASCHFLMTAIRKTALYMLDP